MPSYGTWQDVPVYEQNYIKDLWRQWNQLVGFTVDPPDWALAEMASEGVSNLFSMGQYMWGHVNRDNSNPGAYFVSSASLAHAPGARWGLTNDDAHGKLQAYQTMMKTLTGTGGNIDDYIDRMNRGQGTINTGLMREEIMQDAGMRNTYGWLKYGMDYDQFQQQKLQWQTAFGKELSNEEAVTQLQYAHASASAPHTAEQRPTLSQVEKRQANVGAAQSEVR